MKTSRFFRTAGAGSVLCSLFFLSSIHSQESAPLPTSPLSSQPSAAEKLLFDAANRERAAAGLQPLKWDEALAAAARRHAEHMAHENLLAHQYPGEPSLDERAAQAGAKFSLVAENIAMGGDPETIHDGWMHSSGHRKNILNPEVTAVGIATLTESKRLYAVEDFSRSVTDLSFEQQEAKVVSLLKGTGLLGVTATEDARKTCGMEHGFAGGSVSYVLRFEVADLSKLPDELLQKIKSRAYRRAAVGACRAGDTAGFTMYRIAVLLN
jgi:uncharacterized protein YkwD